MPLGAGNAPGGVVARQSVLLEGCVLFPSGSGLHSCSASLGSLFLFTLWHQLFPSGLRLASYFLSHFCLTSGKPLTSQVPSQLAFLQSFPRLTHVPESPVALVKMQIWTHLVWGEACGITFLTKFCWF